MCQRGLLGEGCPASSGTEGLFGLVYGVYEQQSFT